MDACALGVRLHLRIVIELHRRPWCDVQPSQMHKSIPNGARQGIRHLGAAIPGNPTTNEDFKTSACLYWPFLRTALSWLRAHVPTKNTQPL